MTTTLNEEIKSIIDEQLRQAALLNEQARAKEIEVQSLRARANKHLTDAAMVLAPFNLGDIIELRDNRKQTLRRISVRSVRLTEDYEVRVRGLIANAQGGVTGMDTYATIGSSAYDCTFVKVLVAKQQ